MSFSGGARSGLKVMPFATVICLFLVALATSQQAAATDLIDLADQGIGAGSSVVSGVNTDGNVVVGFVRRGAYYRAFRWNASSGKIDDIGTLGGVFSLANGVNAAGDVVVGESDTSAGVTRAFRWTAADQKMTDLGTLGGSLSAAYAVNAAGDVVVGGANTSSEERHVFRWTAADQKMTDLGTLGGTEANAFAVNKVGDVVVGTSNLSGDAAYRAFRWTLASGTMDDLGTLGGSNSEGIAVNAAGDVVVGYADYVESINGVPGVNNGFRHAFLWTEGSGKMQDLGTLGGNNSTARGINDIGDVVVGESEISSGAVRAFRWTEAGGMQTIEDWLIANGVKVVHFNTRVATDVNAAGDVVVGQLDNGHAFIARATSGLIDVPEFNAGLQSVANSALLGARDADVLHGAHGSPMRSLLPVWRANIWTAGDVGRQEHDAYSSKQGLAEVGYGYRPTQAMQFNIALGRTYSSANTGLGGDTKARSTYLLPELILWLPNSAMLATVSAYYGQGDLRIDRAYRNAGVLTHAYGNPDTETAGIRLRLDWMDAISAGKTRLTPYTSLTYMKTRMDGYTEQGDGFPVLWNKRTENATTAHIGVDAVHPISSTVTVLGRLEAAHRFESQAATVSGVLLGAGGGAFAFRGHDLKRNWLRAGLGLEAKVGGGIANVMLNASTEGEMSTYWLAASYRWVF